jgi:hypothetical protein
MKKIEELQRNYFSTNNKNILFKKKQKLDCATNISKSIDLEQVLNMTFYNIGNTNIIYVDYTIFKTYAHHGYHCSLSQFLFLSISQLPSR